MKNKTAKISVSLIFIFISFIIPVDAIDNHKPIMCDGCHSNGRFDYGLGSDEYCGGCHKYVDDNYKLNMGALESQHNLGTCKACHNIKDSKEFHTLHINETKDCTTCHGATGNAVPTATMNQCGGCHGGKIHDIHKNKLDKICTTCHGSAPDKAPENSIAGFQAANKLYAKAIDYQQYTLLELIKSLFGWKQK